MSNLLKSAQSILGVAAALFMLAIVSKPIFAGTVGGIDKAEEGHGFSAATCWNKAIVQFKPDDNRATEAHIWTFCESATAAAPFMDPDRADIIKMSALTATFEDHAGDDITNPLTTGHVPTGSDNHNLSQSSNVISYANVTNASKAYLLQGMPTTAFRTTNVAGYTAWAVTGGSFDSASNAQYVIIDGALGSAGANSGTLEELVIDGQTIPTLSTTVNAITAVASAATSYICPGRANKAAGQHNSCSSDDHLVLYGAGSAGDLFGKACVELSGDTVLGGDSGKYTGSLSEFSYDATASNTHHGKTDAAPSYVKNTSEQYAKDVLQGSDTKRIRVLFGGVPLPLVVTPNNQKSAGTITISVTTGVDTGVAGDTENTCSDLISGGSALSF
jgi:hypothetical protein